MTRARVAVIEDDTDLREAICLMLDFGGFEATGFSNAKDAIRTLEEGHPADVILLDLMMPIMNGWEFCEYRSRTAILARVPVIIITARRSLTSAPGVSEVLFKPFDAAELEAAIERALAGSSGG